MNPEHAYFVLGFLCATVCWIVLSGLKSAWRGWGKRFPKGYEILNPWRCPVHDCACLSDWGDRDDDEDTYFLCEQCNAWWWGTKEKLSCDPPSTKDVKAVVRLRVMPALRALHDYVTADFANRAKEPHLKKLREALGWSLSDGGGA